jgi:hypothetical protein
VERLEATQKRKSKETKNREFFEKVFPELRKQREDKERFNRVGARIKSEADLEEIMDGLQEQEVYYITNSICIKAITKRAMYDTSRSKNDYGENKTVGWEEWKERRY